MIYPYRCRCCDKRFEVIKSVSEINNDEHCPNCDNLADRYIAQRQFFYGAKVEDAYYCPALGQIIKSKNHRNQVAKSKGLVEVGNDDPPENYKRYDAERERRAASKYDEFFAPIEVSHC